jgi:phosphatidylglycerophosphatase C
VLNAHSPPLAERAPHGVLAAFDFDGTITDRHTFWRYLRFVATPRAFWASLVPLAPRLGALATRRITLMEAREALIARFLGGLPAAEEAELARRFAEEHLPRWIRPAALRRLRWHRARGHRTVLVSNGLESYLAPWAVSVGFDDVLGTRLEARGGRLTGRVEGAHCVGAEKVRRLTTLVGDRGLHYLFAYGDSAGDRELLAAADTPFYRNWS